MEIIKDTFRIYEEYKRKIGELEDEQIKLMKEVAGYVIDFGKYKGLTLAQIAYKDSHYYQWLKQKNLIPYIIHPIIDHYVMTAVHDYGAYKQAQQHAEMLGKQGFEGRYD